MREAAEDLLDEKIGDFTISLPRYTAGETLVGTLMPLAGRPVPDWTARPESLRRAAAQQSLVTTTKWG